MSSKLNRTWTLLPEDENQNEDDDMQMDIDIQQTTDDVLFQTCNRSNLLDEEEMCIDLTNNSVANNKNQTRVISDMSYTLDKTHNVINNKTINLNETVNKSPISLKESLSVNYIYDINRISIELENSINRFSVIDDRNFESLFDETITGIDFYNGGPMSNPCSPKQSITNLNNLTVNLDHPKTESQAIPKLQKQQSINSPLCTSLSASIDNLDNLKFNPSSVPKSFDLFMNDLKKSSSSISLNSLNSHSQTNLASGLLTKRIITSSIDKDLHKEFKLNKINNLSHLKETDADIKTSSPLKNKKFNLNATIDLNTRNMNSNESLNESEQSLSVSQSSSIANFNLQNDDDPRTVFNSTYTAWAASDQQMQIDAYNQHRKITQSTSSIGLNRTQDMNNNTSRDDLNKTKDIIHDSQDNLNRTVDLKQPSKVLNTTQDLSEPSTNFKPIQASQLRRISSIQSTRPSSIYQKSKLISNLNPKPVSSLPQVKTDIKKIPTIGSKLVQPIVAQSLDTAKPKIVKNPLVKSVTSPVKSPVLQSQLQRPNTLTTQNTNSIQKIGLTSNSSQAVNLNRLSSTSSSSSTSTSSSSSLKENKKSPTSHFKSPTSKIGTLTQNSLNQNTGLSRLKPPSVCSIPAPKPSVIPQPGVFNSKITPVETNQPPKSMLKPPTQIPTFKVPTGIPTLRNATNKK